MDSTPRRLGTEHSSASELIDAYKLMRPAAGVDAARSWLSGSLAQSPPQVWLDCARRFAEQNETAEMVALLEASTNRWPDAHELRYALAVALRHDGRPLHAEAQFRTLLEADPGNRDAAFALAAMLRDDGRLRAAGDVLVHYAMNLPSGNTEGLLECMSFLRQCQRQRSALELCESTLAAGQNDPRLHYFAGELALTLGDFARAREHLLCCVDRLDGNVWFSLQALADTQRYEDASHPDFTLFERALQNSKLSVRGRASVLFARGKAYDDIGDFVSAANAWREANGLIYGQIQWSTSTWRHLVATQCTLRPSKFCVEPSDHFVPVFIVGMPRSGTTLLAQLLSRYPQVRNRGELNLIPYIWRKLRDANAQNDERACYDASRLYYAHVRQDDTPARWYIDKYPMNFCHLDLVARLFPNARIVYCRRDRRDTALSIWSHFFASGQNEFAYRFDDIAEVMAGCERLMTHWKSILPIPIFTIDYEKLVTAPQDCCTAVASFLGLEGDTLENTDSNDVTIESSSLWQARQPVYERSVGRWWHYADHLPELLHMFLEGSV